MKLSASYVTAAVVALAGWAHAASAHSVKAARGLTGLAIA